MRACVRTPTHLEALVNDHLLLLRGHVEEAGVRLHLAEARICDLLRRGASAAAGLARLARAALLRSHTLMKHVKFSGFS